MYVRFNKALVVGVQMQLVTSKAYADVFNCVNNLWFCGVL